MNLLGIEIRKLRLEKGISQKEMARALNIGQTTIANYEADTRQPNLEKLTQIADYFDVSIDELLGRNGVSGSILHQNPVQSSCDWTYDDHEIESVAKIYLEYLLEHKKIEAIEFVRMLYKKGMKITDIYTEVFVKCLHEAGRLWESGIINVGEEHYISEVTQSLISHFSIAQRSPRKSMRKALIVSIYGEKHSIAGKILADFFDRSGIETYYLGRDVPIRSLIDSLISTNTRLLAISVTMLQNLEPVEMLIHSLKEHPKLANLKVLVGGQAFESDTSIWKQLGADGYARDFDEAVQVAHDLLNSLEKEPDNEKQ